MKYNNLKKKKLTNKYKHFIEQPNQSIFVFPFEITFGYSNMTDWGEQVNNNINVNDFKTFQRVFSGTENIIARWENSTRVFIKNETDDYINKKFQTGKYLKGEFLSFGSGSRVGASITNLVGWEEEQRITMRFNNKWTFTKEDEFKLFLIPEVKNNQWLFIDSGGLEEFRDLEGNLLHTEVTFTTLNQRLAETGRSIYQVVNFGAIGEGYAFPEILTLDNGEQRINLDRNGEPIVSNRYLRDTPITSVQIDFLGPAAINSFNIYGRKYTKGDEANKIRPFQRLLVNEILTSEESKINRTSFAEQDYYVIKDAYTSNATFNTWKKRYEQNYRPDIEDEFQGLLRSQETFGEVRATNSVADGQRRAIWDDTLLYDYNVTRNLSTNNSFENSTISGTPNAPTTFSGKKTIADILNFNSFTSQYENILTPEIENTTSYSLKEIPIIGGILNKVTLGFPIGWKRVKSWNKNKSHTFLIPTSLYDYSQKQISATDDVKDDQETQIPLENFIEKNFSKNTFANVGTSVHFSLTSTFEKNGNTKDTINLNQSSLDGDKYSKDSKATNAFDNIGYMIDYIDFKALAMCDVRLTFYSGENQVFFSQFQTNSKYKNNIREWTTAYRFSNWKLTEDEEKTLRFPAVPYEPTPDGEIQRFSLLKSISPQIKGSDKNAIDTLLIEKARSTIYTKFVPDFSGNNRQKYEFGMSDTPINQEFTYIDVPFGTIDVSGVTTDYNTFLRKYPKNTFTINHIDENGNIVKNTYSGSTYRFNKDTSSNTSVIALKSSGYSNFISVSALKDIKDNTLTFYSSKLNKEWTSYIYAYFNEGIINVRYKVTIKLKDIDAGLPSTRDQRDSNGSLRYEVDNNHYVQYPSESERLFDNKIEFSDDWIGMSNFIISK